MRKLLQNVPIQNIPIQNAFCPTGEGGGVDPSCGSKIGSVIEVSPYDLATTYPGAVGDAYDQLEESGLSPRAWAARFKFDKPIQVAMRNGRMYVIDGNHRMIAARILGKRLKAKIVRLPKSMREK